MTAIERLIRKVAREFGVHVERVEIARHGYEAHATLTVDGEQWCSIGFTGLRFMPNNSTRYAAIRYEIAGATEQLVSAWHFEQIKERTPDAVALYVGAPCPEHAASLVTHVDWSARTWRCGAHEHAMPATVWDGRRVRVRACPKTHPVDCDCEGALP